MAAVDIGEWIPEEFGGKLITKYMNKSAVEAASTRREPMKTDTKRIPKVDDADVQFTAKGQAYTEDTKGADDLLLDAAKLTHLSKYNDEDLEDVKSYVNATNAKKDLATGNLALLYDNASLAVTADGDGSVTKPYDSVYFQVNAFASANVITIAANATKAAQRDAILSALEIAENSEWVDGDLCWLMSPAFKNLLRGLDATGAQGINLYSGPNGAGGDSENLNGSSMFWSRAMRLTASATHKPTNARGTKGTVGNAFAVVGPRSGLVVGDRAPLESQFLDANTGVGTLTDSAYLKMRRRAAFNIVDPSAFSVVELVA